MFMNKILIFAYLYKHSPAVRSYWHVTSSYDYPGTLKDISHFDLFQSFIVCVNECSGKFFSMVINNKKRNIVSLNKNVHFMIEID